jgi:hypothetical protein
LRGCINDTIEMQGLLTGYFGFQDENIKLLHDADATAQGIRDGLGWLLDEYEGDGRDVRVFHFSSHGTYVDDQDGDEREGLDEVIVTQDHDWDNPFRDDHLREIFDKIPEGVNFTFVADCCHSGTIQKEIIDSQIEFRPRFLTPPPEIVDSVERKLAARDAEARAWARKELLKIISETPEHERDLRTDAVLVRLTDRYRQNKYAVVAADRHILLAACEDRQTAADARIEGEWQGAFTWALSRAVKNASGDLTYEALIQQASANLQGFAQRPQLETPPKMRELKAFAPLG